MFYFQGEDCNLLIPLLCSQLAYFCLARIECINLYTQISKSSLQNDVNFLLEGITSLEQYKMKLACPVLNELQVSFFGTSKKLFIDETFVFDKLSPVVKLDEVCFLSSS